MKFTARALSCSGRGVIYLIVSASGMLTAKAEGPLHAQPYEHATFTSLSSEAPPLTESEIMSMAEHPDSEFRRYAALRLAELESLSDSSLLKLIDALGDESEDVRLQALAGLMRIGRPATAVLVKALMDFEQLASFRYYSEIKSDWHSQAISRSDLAFTALFHSTDVDLGVLLRAYRHAQGEDARRILMVVEDAAAELTPELYSALGNGDKPLKLCVVRIFGQMGSAAAKAVPSLAKIIRYDDDDSVREAAAEALAAIPDIGPRALRELLEDPSSRVRSLAITWFPPGVDGAAGLIVRSLDDPEAEVRATALKWLRDSSGCDDDPQVSRPKGIETPSSSSLAELSDSDYARLLESLSDSDPTLRVLALEALTSLACARPEFAYDIADVLVTKLADPTDEVAFRAVAMLKKLAEFGIFPSSAETLYHFHRDRDSGSEDRRLALIALLMEAKYGNVQDDLFFVLERIELPDSHQEDWCRELIAECLDDLECARLEAVIVGREDWQRAAIEAWMNRHPAWEKLAPERFGLLTKLGPRTPAYDEVLTRLLDHFDSGIRSRASIILAARGNLSPRIWEVLQDGAQSLDVDAASALAGLGERGVAQIVAIAKEPANGADRWVLIRDVLSDTGAEGSPLAVEFLLDSATDQADPRLQCYAVEALRTIDAPMEKVRSALDAALSAEDADVRRSAVIIWGSRDLPLSGLVQRAIGDPAPQVRETAVRLLAKLPEGDPLRSMVIAAAVVDAEDFVRRAAFETTRELGADGSSTLAEYVDSGQPLAHEFFDNAELLVAPSAALIAALEARSETATDSERQRINSVLASADTRLVNLEALYSQLTTAQLRVSAARTLLALGEDPWNRGSLLAAVAMASQVRWIVEERLGQVLDVLYRPSRDHEFSRGPREPSLLPAFPWPPPPRYHRTVVPRRLVATRKGATLGDVYGTLVNGLERASDGFEHGLFRGAPAGFVLVARMERIRRNGTPFPEPDRWVTATLPKPGFWEFLGDLFFEQPGYFRTIVFAVTSDLVPGWDIDARLREPIEGATDIPYELANQPFDDQRVLTLVYTFQRRGAARVTPWPSSPSAKQHLRLAGVWANFRVR